MIKKYFCEASHSHSHLILDPGSAYPVHARGGEAPSSVIVVCRSRIQDQVAVAVVGGGAVAVAVAGLTKRFFNHIQKDFLINVWGIILHSRMMCRMMRTYHPIILQARRGIDQICHA